jgi:surfactin synthase thioesterase subunit
MSNADNLWFRRYHEPRDGAVQLFCLPHAGGSASFYHPMSAALSPGVEVLAVQYPGRQDRRREPGVNDLRELADRIAEALQRRPEQPWALFGHSYGATLSFEVAARMQAAGRPPRHVFASGRRAPSRHRVETVHRLGDAGLLTELRALAGTDARILGDEELLRMVLPAIRSDYTAAETYVYRPGPPLSCPVTVLTGDADPKTTPDEARAWQEHTTGAFDLQVYAGGHFFLANHQPAILRLLAERLNAGLAVRGA